MKIKILKSSEPSYWYSSHIGGTFDVVMKGELRGIPAFYVSHGGVGDKYLVSSMDCEVVEFLPVKTSEDNINPSHYKSSAGFECIDVITEVTKGLEGMEAVCTSQVIKYTYRWKRKNGLEDLKKAKWYHDNLINRLENEDK